MIDRVHLLTAVLFLVYAATGAAAPIHSLYLEELGANYAQISIVLTTYAVILMIANYLWGRLSDALGRRKPMVVGGLFGLSFTFGLLALVPTYTLAWGVRLVEAVALAAYTTTSLAFMGDLLAATETSGRRMGTYRGFGSLSFALGAFGAGPIIDYLGMGVVYGVGACSFLVAALVALTVREETGVVSASPETEANSKPDSTRHLPILFLLGVLLWACAFSAAYSMWPNFLTSLGYPQSTASWLWGIAAISEVPFMAVVGSLADTAGRVPVLVMGGFGMSFVIMGYIVLNQWLVGLAGVQFFRGFAYSSFTATSMIYSVETGTKRSRAGTVGLYQVAMSLGQILGLAAGGQIVQRTGFQTLFWVSSLLFICSGLVFGLLRWRQPLTEPVDAVQAKNV